MFNCCEKCVKAVQNYWPDINIDGHMNLWIVKPAASSRGRGIRIKSRLNEILEHCKQPSLYVIQKYIGKSGNLKYEFGHKRY